MGHEFRALPTPGWCMGCCWTPPPSPCFRMVHGMLLDPYRESFIVSGGEAAPTSAQASQQQQEAALMVGMDSTHTYTHTQPGLGWAPLLFSHAYLTH